MDSIVTTIKALLAKANNAASTQAEIESAIALANRLMTKHEISMIDVEERDVSNFGFRMYDTGSAKKDAMTNWGVASALAKFCNLKIYCSVKRDPMTFKKSLCLALYGEESDKEVFVYFFEAIRAYMNSSFRDYLRKNPEVDGRRARDPFTKGVAGAVSKKIVAEITQRDREFADAVASSTGTSLVVTKMQTVEREYAVAVKNEGLKFTKPTSVKARTNDSYFSGQSAGEKFNMKRGIGETTRQTKAIA